MAEEKRLRRARVSQADVPRHSLDDALSVARAIADEYGRQPTKPLDVAAALEISPTSSRYRTLTGAAVAYGLTDGAYNAGEIGLTELGRRIVAPLEEGDDVAAKREAFLRPRVIKEFLSRYNGSKVPSDRIATNVLGDIGVPADSAERVLKLIVAGADKLQLLRHIKQNTYVALDGGAPGGGPPPAVSPTDGEDEGPRPPEDETPPPPAAESPAVANRRVFITHGKNRAIADQLKELLAFGDFEPVVSVDRESLSKPVPQKVMDEMRTCGAAIIHVGSERRLLDQSGDEVVVLNENVLIEIGAAMALYEGRFILLVETGVKLPSNLQGLYEVRYCGEKLDYEATMKLLKAFNEFKT